MFLAINTTGEKATRHLRLKYMAFLYLATVGYGLALHNYTCGQASVKNSNSLLITAGDVNIKATRTAVNLKPIGSADTAIFLTYCSRAEKYCQYLIIKLFNQRSLHTILLINTL